MAILPVWCEGWGLGCCGDDFAADVGQEWRMTLAAYLRDVSPTDRALGWAPTASHELSIVAETRRTDASHQPVIDIGAQAIAVRNEIDGRFQATARIYGDWHIDIDRGLIDLVTVRGVVRRIFQMRWNEPATQIPTELSTTRNWLQHGLDDAVVELDVGGALG